MHLKHWEKSKIYSQRWGLSTLFTWSPCWAVLRISVSLHEKPQKVLTYMTCIKWVEWSQRDGEHYLSKLMRGSGGRALSTGYRSLTAILTSSTSAVRNRNRFRMVYSWSAKMMFPWQQSRVTLRDKLLILQVKCRHVMQWPLTLSYSSTIKW